MAITGGVRGPQLCLLGRRGQRLNRYRQTVRNISAQCRDLPGRATGSLSMEDKVNISLPVRPLTSDAVTCAGISPVEFNTELDPSHRVSGYGLRNPSAPITGVSD